MGHAAHPDREAHAAVEDDGEADVLRGGIPRRRLDGDRTRHGSPVSCAEEVAHGSAVDTSRGRSAVTGSGTAALQNQLRKRCPRSGRSGHRTWWGGWGSNPRPRDYESHGHDVGRGPLMTGRVRFCTSDARRSPDLFASAPQAPARSCPPCDHRMLLGPEGWARLGVRVVVPAHRTSRGRVRGSCSSVGWADWSVLRAWRACGIASAVMRRWISAGPTRPSRATVSDSFWGRRSCRRGAPRRG